MIRSGLLNEDNREETFLKEFIALFVSVKANVY